MMPRRPGRVRIAPQDAFARAPSAPEPRQRPGQSRSISIVLNFFPKSADRTAPAPACENLHNSTRVVLGLRWVGKNRQGRPAQGAAAGISHPDQRTAGVQRGSRLRPKFTGKSWEAVPAASAARWDRSRARWPAGKPPPPQRDPRAPATPPAPPGRRWYSARRSSAAHHCLRRAQVRAASRSGPHRGRARRSG